MRRSCDLFRPLNRSVCGTCHFLYACWLWDIDSPVSFGETVSFLALGHQGLSCTCHIFVGLLVFFRTVYDSLVSFGETVSFLALAVSFLALGRQFLNLRPSGTLMNLSSFCNPVVFWALSMTALSLLVRPSAFMPWTWSFLVFIFYELSYPPWWAVGFSLS